MNYKYVLSFMLGAGIGGLGVGLYFKKKYQKESSEERASTREYYKKKLDEMNEKLNRAYEEKAENDISEPEKIPEEEKSEARDETEVEQKVNYNDISTKKAREKKQQEYSEYLDAVNETGYTKVDKKPLPLPYVISDTDYHEESLYDKVSLVYHQEDGIVENIKGEALENGIDLIGAGNLEFFGEYEPDTLFVRNEVYGTDFEVSLEEGKYEG